VGHARRPQVQARPGSRRGNRKYRHPASLAVDFNKGPARALLLGCVIDLKEISSVKQ
jgi:hypothetical protein